MRHLTIAAALTCLLQGPVALAQPTTDEPGLSPAPPEAVPAPPVAYPRGRPGRMHRNELHAYLMANNPQYRSNRRMMLGGILTASVGGGVSMLVMVIGLSGMMADDVYYGQSGEQDTFRALVTVGLTSMVVSLAVGLPLTFVGRSRANAILKRRMRFSAGVLPGGGVVGVTWRF